MRWSPTSSSKPARMARATMAIRRSIGSMIDFATRKPGEHDSKANARFYRSGTDGDSHVDAAARDGMGRQRLESGAGADKPGGRSRSDREGVAGRGDTRQRYRS